MMPVKTGVVPPVLGTCIVVGWNVAKNVPATALVVGLGIQANELLEGDKRLFADSLETINAK
jgi:hypothetical protein